MVITRRVSDTLRIELDDPVGSSFCTVRLSGELDLVSADDVRAAIIASTSATVVVDLTELEFLDSSGLSALITARRRVEAGGSRVLLRGARGAARRVFEVSGLDDVLEDGPTSD
jgi:anti-sigma B factor antagonist